MFPTEGTGCFWVERCFENTGVCLWWGHGRVSSRGSTLFLQLVGSRDLTSENPGGDECRG